MAFRDTIKNWFKHGLYPDQAQFWETWDKIWMKDEKLPLSSINGLQDTLNTLANPLQIFTKDTPAGTPFPFKVPAGYTLETVYIEPTVDCSVTYVIGVLPEDPDTDILIGADYEILAEDIAIGAGKFGTFDNKVPVKVDTYVNFYNVPVNTVMTFIKRRIRIPDNA